MTEETINFINEGFDEYAKTNKLLDYESFVSGAEYVIDHLIKKGKL